MSTGGNARGDNGAYLTQTFHLLETIFGGLCEAPLGVRQLQNGWEALHNLCERCKREE